MSGRLFDRTARPLLYRLLAAVLADRRRLDVSRDVQAAREALGDDLWQLLDPARPASDDSQQPGVSQLAAASRPWPPGSPPCSSPPSPR